MKYSNPAMLLYIAMADAYAAGVEYLSGPTADTVRADAMRLTSYVKRPKGDLMPGQYTDDTEMSIANTRVLVEHRPPYTPLMFADAYVREFVFGGRRHGYARGFYDFLCSVSSGKEFIERIRSDSTRNGAAMRAVPLGVLRTVNDVLETARVQAMFTHNTPEGIFSAEAVALMSHYALYESSNLCEVGAYCLETLRPRADGYVRTVLESIFLSPWSGVPVHHEPYGCEALTTVHAVVHLLREEQSLRAMLMRTIEWGGDTDSVAAIAWGIASTRHQDEVLPAFLEQDLEPSSPHTGSGRLLALSKELMDTYAR